MKAHIHEELIDPKSGAPRDADALHRCYRDYVCSIVLKVGIPPSEAEDVTSDILVTFLEKGMLEKYEPNRLHDISKIRGRPSQALLDGPQLRPARFTSYLRRFAFLYSLQHRDKINARHRREALTLDGPDRSDAPDHHDAVEVVLRRSAAGQAILAAVPTMQETNSPNRRWNLFEAFVACAHSVERNGRVVRAEVAAELGISTSAVRDVMVALRKVLQETGADEALTWTA